MNKPLEAFRSKIEHELVFGELADMDLAAAGGAAPVVVVALASEPLGALTSRVANAGDCVNVFVADNRKVHLLTVRMGRTPLLRAGVEDMRAANDQPSPDTTVGMFVTYLKNRPAGIALPKELAPTTRETTLRKTLELQVA